MVNVVPHNVRQLTSWPAEKARGHCRTETGAWSESADKRPRPDRRNPGNDSGCVLNWKQSDTPASPPHPASPDGHAQPGSKSGVTSPLRVFSASRGRRVTGLGPLRGDRARSGWGRAATSRTESSLAGLSASHRDRGRGGRRGRPILWDRPLAVAFAGMIPRALAPTAAAPITAGVGSASCRVVTARFLSGDPVTTVATFTRWRKAFGPSRGSPAAAFGPSARVRGRLWSSCRTRAAAASVWGRANGGLDAGLRTEGAAREAVSMRV